MIKFTAVSIVLYLANLFMIRIYFKRSYANVRYVLNVEKSWEKIWYSITVLWLVLNILCVAGTAIKLIFMYLQEERKNDLSQMR